jgi:hypothetical protein
VQAGIRCHSIIGQSATVLAFEIAEAIDALIAANYPHAEVWAMTPREIGASLYFAKRRRKREAAEQLALSALAARRDSRALRQQITDLQRD